MSQINANIKKLHQFDVIHKDALKKLINKLKKILEGKREIMYSDIINLIIRGNFKGEVYNQLIRWCNLNIKFGNFIVDKME
jgi:hypothetical protein